jgi:ribosome recycling factor
MPQLSEERRRDYIKVARSKAEESRVAVRNIRRHANDSVHKLAKDKEVGEDDARGAEKQLDGVTKKYVETIDELLKAKEAELLEV